MIGSIKEDGLEGMSLLQRTEVDLDRRCSCRVSNLAPPVHKSCVLPHTPINILIVCSIPVIVVKWFRFEQVEDFFPVHTL
jgi:hypothetical protein